MNCEPEKLTKSVLLRLTEYEKNFIKGLADIYANGNVTMFLVYAAFNSDRKFITDDDLPESRRRTKRGRPKTAQICKEGLARDNTPDRHNSIS